jgi:hypothetical protein
MFIEIIAAGKIQSYYVTTDAELEQAFRKAIAYYSTVLAQ